MDSLRRDIPNYMLENVRSSFDAYSDNSREEFVKCVVIGDSYVGKTRLICSYIYDQPGISPTLLNQRPRVPTVFAIDQYTRDPTVKDRAHVNVDGVATQLRIWDTFGYHDKNRQYAFQNAHVIVLCFNIGCSSSHRNINDKWYPEIKKYCPRAPIVLVGTQLDRRYMDPNAFSNNTKVTTLTDVLLHGNKILPVSRDLPEECISQPACRQTAKEISAACYVEASIANKFGVAEVFEKAVRVALVHRYQQRPMLSSHLKHIRKPSLQIPFIPPKSDPPAVEVMDQQLYDKFTYFTPEMDDDLCDVTFLVDGDLVHAHIIVLGSGCPVLFALFTHPKVLSCLQNDTFFPDSPITNILTEVSFINGIATDGIPRGFEAIDTTIDLHRKCKVFVKVKNVSTAAFRSILEQIYTGKMSHIREPMEVLDAAEYLQMTFVAEYVSNILNHESYKNEALTDFHTRRTESMAKHFLRSSLFVDVAFVLEDAVVHAHKHVLVSRCPVMAGMFRRNSFRESLMENVDFRDTSLDSFLGVLEYLYTGDCREHKDDVHGTLQLANFLCLPRLVTFCEREIVNRLDEMHRSGMDEVYSIAIASYNIAKYHNAPQLADWCLHFMSSSYNDLCKKTGKDMQKHLDEETRGHLEEHRWPPIWYLKEQDFYERSMRQIEKEQMEVKTKKRKKHGGCFRS